jgi:hypothetical protein
MKKSDYWTAILAQTTELNNWLVKVGYKRVEVDREKLDMLSIPELAAKKRFFTAIIDGPLKDMKEIWSLLPDNVWAGYFNPMFDCGQLREMKLLKTAAKNLRRAVSNMGGLL